MVSKSFVFNSFRLIFDSDTYKKFKTGQIKDITDSYFAILMISEKGYIIEKIKNETLCKFF